MRYNLAIIGGGPGGYTAAFKAADLGLAVILFESDKIGGTCLNRGCIPTKSLLHSSNAYHKLDKLAEIGVNVAEKSFDYERILQRKAEVVDGLRNGIEKSLKTKRITVINGKAVINADRNIECNDEVFEADNIVICTGSVPSLPPIEGIEKALTSDDILENNSPLYDSLVIIGGGVIGLEVASIYLNLGRKVTILEMADQLIPTMDKELATRIGVYLKKAGAEIVTKAAVKQIAEGENEKIVTYLDKNGNEKEATGQQVLCAAGRRANVSGLFRDIDVTVNRGIVTDERYETDVKGIYAIGDCRSGNIQLAHVAMAQAENVVDMITGKDKCIDDDLIPSCIYTEPEIASVGLTETEAKARGINVLCKKTLTGANGKSVIEQADSGYLKLVINSDTQQIIGAQLICPDATNLVGELAVIIQKKMTVSQLKEIVHPHPTVVEMISECLK